MRLKRSGNPSSLTQEDLMHISQYQGLQQTFAPAADGTTYDSMASVSSSWSELAPGLAAAAQEMLYPMDDLSSDLDLNFNKSVDDGDFLQRLLNNVTPDPSLDESPMIFPSSIVTPPLQHDQLAFLPQVNTGETIESSGFVAQLGPGKRPRLGVVTTGPPSNLAQLLSQSATFTSDTSNLCVTESFPISGVFDREQNKRAKNKIVAKRNREKMRAYKETLEQENMEKQLELSLVQRELSEVQRNEEEERQLVNDLLKVLSDQSALAGLICDVPGFQSYKRQDIRIRGEELSSLRSDTLICDGVCLHVVGIRNAPATIEICSDCALRNTK